MRNRRLSILLLSAIVMGFGACSDSGNEDNPDATADTVDSDGGSDADGTEDTGDDGSPDVSDSTDTDAEVIDPESRPLGVSCIDGVQCASNLCVLFDAGLEGFCSQICDQPTDCQSQDPDAEFRCLNLPQASGDVIRGCIDTTVCFDPDEDGYGVGPGCANTGFDCDQTDSAINPGAPERCDNIDHNCNGLILDAVVFEEPTCDLPSQNGACAVGSRQCDEVFAADGETVIDGTEVCEQVIFPGDLDEVCNGIDDDCDGIRDDFVSEDGVYEVAGLGISCATEVSTCPNGVTACDASSGNVVCVGTGENPNNGDETLVCDGRDNNCNGETDEPFKNEDGIYFMPEHCGSCAVNCDNFWDGRPEDFNVVPSCDVNANFAVCGFDCAEGFVNADGLDDNGCELNPDEAAIYVTRAARGGVDNGSCGSYLNPCATIAFAINKAANDGSKSRVRVAEGSYPVAVDLVDGISVLGGHNAVNWTRDVDANVTTLTGTLDDGAQNITVRAQGISTPTEFSGFRIQPSAASAGRNSIGMFVVNSTSALRVLDNDIQASAGGRGVEGSRGTNGSGGTNGSAGADTRNSLSSCTQPSPGGSGAVKSCVNLRDGGSIVVSGGAGASADGCPEFAERQGPGAVGVGPNASGGTGGVSADSRRGIEVSSGFGTSRTCSSPKDNDFNDGNPAIFFPEVGARGTAGDDGAAGQGADSGQGSISSNVWRGESGSSGVSGVPGGGGGGGGSSHGIHEDSGQRYIGATGGGAGSGGCAGSNGGGGSAGGGSFALVLVAGASTAEVPEFSGNSFRRGSGGAGGAGGVAGSGGDGGAPGQGGTGLIGGSGDFAYCLADGRAGGSGGRGGHGGGGGGGAGGASYDVLVVSTNASDTVNAAGLDSDNEFPLDMGLETGGQGGSGGSSRANSGEDGAAGAAGRLLQLQP